MSRNTITEESSGDEQVDEESLDGSTVPDSGISENSSEISSISVSGEIRRFQQKIDRVRQENGQYSRWRQERQQDFSNEMNLNEKQKYNKYKKRVSYHEENVLSDARDLPYQGNETRHPGTLQCGSILENIPSNDNVKIIDYSDKDSDSDCFDTKEEDSPILPSVKELTGKFNILKAADDKLQTSVQKVIHP